MSEPVRIDGQPGYETRIDATSGKDNTPVTIVQWLRFGAQTSMRIIGSVAARPTGPRPFRASAPCATAFSRAADCRKFASARRNFGLYVRTRMELAFSLSGLTTGEMHHV